jgi:hypothetical protein
MRQLPLTRTEKCPLKMFPFKGCKPQSGRFMPLAWAVSFRRRSMAPAVAHGQPEYRHAPFLKKSFQTFMPECLNHGWSYRMTLQVSMILKHLWYTIAAKKSGNAIRGFP